MDLPRVLIEGRYLRGVGTPADLDQPDLEVFKAMPFREAIETCHPWDAHFVTYDVKGMEHVPRLRKHTQLQEQLTADGRLFKWGVALDYDLPGHGSWTVEAVLAHEEQLRRASRRCPLLASWAVYYRTRRGARLVYVFEEPVDVQQGEMLTRGLLRLWELQGVLFDPACGDWTRFFRLPRVMRDDTATWDLSIEPHHDFEESLTARLAGCEIPKLLGAFEWQNCQKLPSATRRETGAPMPTPQEALELRAEHETKWTELLAEPNKHAATRGEVFQEWLPVLLGRRTFAVEAAARGGRNPSIQSLAGALCEALSTLTWGSPELAYALVVENIAAAFPGEEHRVTEWWAACDRYWPGVDATGMDFLDDPDFKARRGTQRAAANNQRKAEAALAEGKQLSPQNRALLEQARHTARQALEELKSTGRVAGPFERPVLHAMALLQHLDIGEYQELMESFGIKVSKPELRKAITKVAKEERLARKFAEESDASAEAILRSIAASADIYIGRSDGGRAAWASVTVRGHLETWQVNSVEFEDWLIGQFFDRTGAAPNATALEACCRSLSAQARNRGVEHDIYLRVAWLPDRSGIAIDLGDSDWRVLLVTGAGWRVVPAAESPVRFRRTARTAALPEPVSGGSLEDLWSVVRVLEPDRVLVAAWLLRSLVPGPPYPFLILGGQQESAKTTTGRCLASLVDPSEMEDQGISSDPEALNIAALQAHVMCFDNVAARDIPPWVSNNLCRLSTGSGFAKRELYSDTSEVIIKVARPILFNGIDFLAAAADLGRRVILVRLPRISGDELEYAQRARARFDRVRPQVFGVLVNGLVTALRSGVALRIAGELSDEADPVKAYASQFNDTLNGMPDLAAWVCASEEALGFAPGDFLRAYAASRGVMAEQGIEADPVAFALVEFLDAQKAPGAWEGTMEALRQKLELRVTPNARRSWPATARAFSDRLERAEAPLRVLGVVIDRRKSHGKRLLAIRRCAP